MICSYDPLEPSRGEPATKALNFLVRPTTACPRPWEGTGRSGYENLDSHKRATDL